MKPANQKTPAKPNRRRAGSKRVAWQTVGVLGIMSLIAAFYLANSLAQVVVFLRGLL